MYGVLQSLEWRIRVFQLQEKRDPRLTAWKCKRTVSTCDKMKSCETEDVDTDYDIEALEDVDADDDVENLNEVEIDDDVETLDDVDIDNDVEVLDDVVAEEEDALYLHFKNFKKVYSI